MLTREQDSDGDSQELVAPSARAPNGEAQTSANGGSRDHAGAASMPTKTDSAPGQDATRSRDETPYPRLAHTNSQLGHEKEAWRAGGIRFAPLRIPMARRLQTAAVCFHCMSVILMVSLFWFTCANPLTWPILVPYLIHLSLSTAASDGKLSLRSEKLRSLPL